MDGLWGYFETACESADERASAAGPDDENHGVNGRIERPARGPLTRPSRFLEAHLPVGCGHVEQRSADGGLLDAGRAVQGGRLEDRACMTRSCMSRWIWRRAPRFCGRAPAPAAGTDRRGRIRHRHSRARDHERLDPGGRVTRAAVALAIRPPSFLPRQTRRSHASSARACGCPLRPDCWRSPPRW